MDLKAIVEKVVEMVKGGKLDLSSIMNGDASSVLGALSGAGIDLGSNDISKVIEMAKSVLSSADGSLDGIVDAAKDAADGLKDLTGDVQDAAEGAVSDAKEAVEGAAEDATEEAGGILGKITDVLERPWA